MTLWEAVGIVHSNIIRQAVDAFEKAGAVDVRYTELRQLARCLEQLYPEAVKAEGERLDALRRPTP
jgi:hypothetical protein